MHLRVDGLKQVFHAFTVAVLCTVLIEQPLAAAGPLGVGSVKQVQGDERVLHALNRLTFGPRPGDVEAVKAMGLKRWFDQQLNPGGIDDSELKARLANFPAMQLSQQELMHRYPSPQMLRAMEKQNLPLPTDATERAIYADQMAFYAMQQEKKAAAKAGGDAGAADKAGNGTGEGMNNGTGEGMKAAAKADGAAIPDAAAMDPGGRGRAVHDEQLFPAAEAANIIALPPDARMRQLLGMPPKSLVAFRNSLTPRELADAAQGLSPQQREILAALPGSLRMVGGELLQSRLLRDIYSNRQLEAVMTDFWLNHFNIYLRKNQNEPYLLPAFERDVVRPNALGNFESLLVATAQSPAMLMYLDNFQSIGPDSPAARNAPRLARFIQNPQLKQAAKERGLNENYARELMELHTLGVNGGYTQADVTEVAKVFTGWTIDRPAQGAAYEFEPLRHEPGVKQVLGTTIRAGGEEEGLEVLHLLATSPATAHFISTKLAVRFVADNPPPALVDRMSKAFLASGGDIKTVLRAMVDGPEFWSVDAVRAKVKTPLEFVVSAARASNAEIANAQPLVQSLDRLGMPLYGMQTPNGYSWLAEPWVSTGALVSRMNFALVLAGDKLPGVRTGLEPLLGRPAGVRPVALPLSGSPSGAEAPDPTVAAKERQIELLLLGQSVSDRTRATVLRQCRDTGVQRQAARAFAFGPGTGDPGMGPGSDQSREGAGTAAPPGATEQTEMMAGLLLGSPEFQRR